MEINRIYKQLPIGEPYSFDFVIETVGTLDIPYIIQRACDVGQAMMSRFMNINTEGFDAKANGLTIQPSVKNAFGIDFIMEHQDHTFGNMIQTYLSENHMADTVQKGSGIQPIVYVGYEIPHQLRDEMVLRIGLDINSKEIEKDARNAFAQACDGCYNILSRIQKAFANTPLEHRDGFTAAATAVAKPKSKIPLGKKKETASAASAATESKD
jgi:DNA-directed RNA polymerase subunit L